MDSSELKSNLIDLESRILEIRNGIFDVASKESRLQEISKQLSSEDVWSDLDLSQKLSKEKASIEKSLTLFLNTEIQVNDNLSLLDMAEEESDLETINEKKINPSDTINMELLKKLKLINKNSEKLKILGTGEIKDKINIEADLASKSAIEKLEKIGGSIQLKK